MNTPDARGPAGPDDRRPDGAPAPDEAPPLGDTPSMEELLLSRVLDREASPADWERLRGLAAQDDALWARLGDALHDDALLRAAVEPGLRLADTSAPPVAATLSAAGSAALVRWSGWAAAALLLVALGLVLRDAASPLEDAFEPSSGSLAVSGRRGGDGVVPATGPLAGGSPEATLVAAEGRETTPTPGFAGEAPSSPGRGPELVLELPPRLVGTRVVQGGEALEVLTMRTVVEREIVTDAYEVSRDELGRPSTVPLDLSSLDVPEIL